MPVIPVEVVAAAWSISLMSLISTGGEEEWSMPFIEPPVAAGFSALPPQPEAATPRVRAVRTVAAVRPCWIFMKCLSCVK